MWKASFILVASLLASNAALASSDFYPRPVDGPPAETRMIPYSGLIPPCEDPTTLAWISGDFATREASPLGSGLAIAAFDDIRETGYRSNGASYIPRRYCKARALLSDGKTRSVGYEIAEQQGFIGWGYGVLWCVVGFDRYRAFAPACKMTQP
jgi:hypothetical protein